MDVVEIPSHVLETYLRSPTTLPLLARHCTTGQAMPSHMADKLVGARTLFAALDLEQQVRFHRAVQDNMLKCSLDYIERIVLHPICFFI